MMKKKLSILFILLAAFALALPHQAQAKVKKKTMTAYDEIIKSGNNVYCNLNWGIYRVNIKTKKVKIVLSYDDEDGIYYALKKKGNYLYGLQEGPTGTWFDRIKISNGKVQTIFYKTGEYEDPANVEAYVISKNKLYFKDTGSSKAVSYVSKLNGKSRKRTKIQPVLKRKKSNTKGYKIIEKKKDDETTYYLKTPKKKYKITTYINEDYDWDAD